MEVEERETCKERGSWLVESSFMILVLFILLAIILGAVFMY